MLLRILDLPSKAVSQYRTGGCHFQENASTIFPKFSFGCCRELLVTIRTFLAGKERLAGSGWFLLAREPAVVFTLNQEHNI